MLTPDDGNYSSSAYSPDGTRIAYAAEHGTNWAIWVANLDGSNPVRVTEASSFVVSPSWSPDGESIAYASDMEGIPHIWVAPATGGDGRRVTDGATPAFSPQWSPDGERMS